MAILDNQILDRLVPSSRLADVDHVGAEMLRRARFLKQEDREIVDLIVRHRLSRRQVGRVLNLPHGTVARRLQRIGARLYSPLVPALLADRCPLPAEVRQVAIEHVIQGMTLMEIADEHRITISVVKQMIEYVKGWHRGVSLDWACLQTAKQHKRWLDREEAQEKHFRELASV